MAQFCCLLNLLLLLLMLWRVPVIDTRPTRDRPQSDLIAGNEFLKLFLERDELQRDLHSGEFEAVAAKGNGDDDISGKSHATSRGTSARSLDYKARNGIANSNQDAGKQVVKLVTSGSKIVFLEEYDDDDAAVDAVARDIDLQKEHVSTTTTKTAISKQQRSKSTSRPSDEVKVVAVSVSSSSQRASPSRARSATASKAQQSNVPVAHADRRQQHQQAQVAARTTTQAKSRAAPVASTLPTTSIAATADFINRSHKSEFSIEEAEPLTMRQQHKARKLFSSAATASADALDDGGDSQNSASTNIHNVLAALPLSGDSSSAAASAYRGGNDTSLNQAAHINQTPSAEHEFDAHSAVDMPGTSARSMGVEEKLLPFQTVIYHDTQEGHGPQSRSISYSSLSQNVEDLRAWQQQSAGILAEAQFNVSESLKPVTRSQTQTQMHTSEPAKFYSVPAKMYGVPSKFYSEPAKVYSEPAKVYGQPEKFYSEPAKVYSQPAKFYGEPAKVYSQPAKVYSEPAKNYWPNAPAATTTTTTQAPMPAVAPSSRRPAIVSRIAFGEAQTSTAVPSNFQPHSSAPKASTFQQQHRPHSYQHSHANQPTQPRRVLFNLDKLPYDLLNAPQQSSKPLLEPDLSKRVPALAPATFASAHQQPCLESTFSSPALPLPNSQHQQQQQQQRQQHSSLSSNQHSNQNAKGLPNRDLVKCVAQFAPSSAPPTHFTTESSRHIDELYTPTPEQNYEIEESASVMTNGRAHGVQGIGSTTTTTTTTTAAPVARQPTRSRMRYGGGTNANANVAGAVHGDGDGSDDHSNNNNRHNHNYNNNYDDEENVDAAGHKSDIGTGYDGDGDGDGDGDAEDGNSNGDDDSKVAYVVEGRNYRKYRVEEKTDDGFIVGEYGVVDHNDGNLRGVRYTADSTINRSLIQKALLTFLKLK